MVWFGLVEFYGISTFGGYLLPNPIYTCTLNIYDFLWLVFMANSTASADLALVWFGLVWFYGISTIVGY